MSGAEMTGLSARIDHVDWLDGCALLAPGSIDLVYADPPFNTGLTQRGENGSYKDSFGSTAEYIAWLRPRVEACVRVLKPTGSILLHVDWRTSHRCRVLLDEVLGEDRFVNHLIWSYGLGGSSPRRFARKHDDILWYCVDPEGYYFEPPMVAATSVRMRGMEKKATDVLDIPSLNNMARERTGYPTQKPLALLELLVKACSPAGGVVLDPCCGSGTTLAATVRLGGGRRGIGFDVSETAVELSRRRVTEAAISGSPA